VAGAGLAALSGAWRERYARVAQRAEDQAYGVIEGSLVLRGRLPKVGEVRNPQWLGVHAAARRAGVHAAGDDAPPYIPRDLDDELRHRLARAGFVLLVGDSLAGKSRAAFEAMSAVLPGHTLIVPNNREALAYAVRQAISSRRCVLWLNDLERFLGPGGLTTSMVAGIVGASREHRVILATLRAIQADHFSDHDPAADPGLQQARRESRLALEQATQIRVSRVFTAAERQRAALSADDVRIREALAHADQYGIAEYLGAGPDLLADWENAWSANTEPGAPSHPRAAALIAAAVDVRRAGFAAAAPRGLLEAVHQGYLDQRGGARLRAEPLDAAWEWATQPRRATTALLQIEDEQRVRVFDYLVDAVEREVPRTAVPDAVIEAALAAGTAADAEGIAIAAQRQRRLTLAERAWRTAYQRRTRQLGDDHPDAVAAGVSLASVVREQGRREEAEAELRRIVRESAHALGPQHPSGLLARYQLALVLVDERRLEEAEAALTGILADAVPVLGPDHAQTAAVRYQLARLLTRAGRFEEAEAELRALLAAGPAIDPAERLSAQQQLADVLRFTGRLAEAEAAYRDILGERLPLLGSDHPETRATRSALGLLLLAKRQGLVPGVKVMMLGTRGSGKTTLLASMFHHLQYGGGPYGYRLRARLQESARLSAWFNQILDPSSDWPAGTATADLANFEFELVGAADGSEHPVFRIDYADYAGGLLTEPQMPGSTLQNELVAQISTADALFGLVDGQRIHQFFNGEPAGGVYLSGTLAPLIGVLRNADCPVHLVLTKWDLLRDLAGTDNDRLSLVGRLLMAQPSFRSLVRWRADKGQETRLIPVSALGPAFAVRDEDGFMVKLEDGLIEPINLNVLFAVLLADFTRHVGTRLDQLTADDEAAGPRGLATRVSALLVRQRKPTATSPSRDRPSDQARRDDRGRGRALQVVSAGAEDTVAVFDTTFPAATLTPGK